MFYKKKTKKRYKFKISPTLTLLVVVCLLLVGDSLLSSFAQNKTQDFVKKDPGLLLSQDSFLVPASSPHNPDLEVVSKFKTVVTAYSSTPGQTDSTPFITASNKNVEDGIVANNYFPFGTKIKIPELYGDKVFVVEDRMSWKKSNYQFDVWHSNHEKAVNFGAKKTYIEVLER